MTTLERKQRIIEKLGTVQSDNTLDVLLSIIEFEEKKVQPFTDIERQLIKEADRQIDEGNFHTHEAANQQIKAWLNK